jgi:acyl carrier protein
MDDKKLEKTFIALVQAVLPPDPARPPLSRATKLLDDPMIDSLTLASLSASVSETFGIGNDVMAALIPEFHTVGDALDLIKRELGD